MLLTAFAHPVIAAGFGWAFLAIPLFWIAVIVVLAIVVGRRRRRMWGGYGPWDHAGRTAEATLAERFANGDIDEKEYRARLEVLRANGPIPPRP